MSEPQVIDVMDVAQRVLSGSAGLCSLTAIEALALAGFVIKINTGEMPALTMPVDPLERALPASLAASVALSVQRFAALQAALSRVVAEVDQPSADAANAAQDAFFAAFNTLKTRFEKEFPNAGA